MELVDGAGGGDAGVLEGDGLALCSPANDRQGSGGQAASGSSPESCRIGAASTHVVGAIHGRQRAVLDGVAEGDGLGGELHGRGGVHERRQRREGELAEHKTALGERCAVAC